MAANTSRGVTPLAVEISYTFAGMRLERDVLHFNGVPSDNISIVAAVERFKRIFITVNDDAILAFCIAAQRGWYPISKRAEELTLERLIAQIGMIMAGHEGQRKGFMKMYGRVYSDNTKTLRSLKEFANRWCKTLSDTKAKVTFLPKDTMPDSKRDDGDEPIAEDRVVTLIASDTKDESEVAVEGIVELDDKWPLFLWTSVEQIPIGTANVSELWTNVDDATRGMRRSYGAEHGRCLYTSKWWANKIKAARTAPYPGPHNSAPPSVAGHLGPSSRQLGLFGKSFVPASVLDLESKSLAAKAARAKRVAAMNTGTAVLAGGPGAPAILTQTELSFR